MIFFDSLLSKMYARESLHNVATTGLGPTKAHRSRPIDRDTQ